jgi:hypothetical protein
MNTCRKLHLATAAGHITYVAAAAAAVPFTVFAVQYGVEVSTTAVQHTC